MARDGAGRVPVSRTVPAHRRHRARGVLATAGLALMSVWPLLLAEPAASPKCAYEGGSVSIRAGEETVVVQQDGTTGTILVNGVDCSPAAPVAETVTISIGGGTIVEIAMADTAGATIDWGAVDWSLQLGFSIPADLIVDNANGNAGINVTAGASGIDLDADGNLDGTYSGVGVLRLVGGPETDTLSGMGSAETGAPTPTALELSGGPGDDRLSGGAEDDALNCGDGVDWLDYSASAVGVTVDLAAGTATGPGFDTVTACENVAGSAQADTVTGDANANRIAPGLGEDTVDGGDGFDVVGYDDAPAAVVVDLGANTVTGGSGSDTLAGIEGATGSNFADWITGSDPGNVLVGGAGADTVLGLAGDDTLDGGSGIDRVVGGDGEDTCILDAIRRACEPTLRLESSTIEPGGSLTVYGNGWYPENGPVDLRLLPPGGAEPQLLVRVDPNDAWGFEQPLDGPDAEGTYRVEACQPCGDPTSETRSREVILRLATVGPTGAAGPAISLNQNQAGPGDRIHVLGTGWDPGGGKVRIGLEPSASGEPIARATPDSPDGAFDQPIDIPEELDPGSYTVVACQPCRGAGAITRTAELTIPGPIPWIPIVLGLAAAAIVAAPVVRRLIKKPVPPSGPIGSRLELGKPEVRVEAAGNGRPRHAVRLVPRTDPGVQRVEERSPP